MPEVDLKQFISHIQEVEEVIWCGHPVTYRPQVHLPPFLMLAIFMAFAFGITAIPGPISIKLFGAVFINSIFFFLPLLILKAESHPTLLLTNKRVLIFDRKNALLRTHELRDVQISRTRRDRFVVREKAGIDETIKWLCICPVHPEIMAIALQKHGILIQNYNQE